VLAKKLHTWTYWFWVSVGVFGAVWLVLCQFMPSIHWQEKYASGLLSGGVGGIWVTSWQLKHLDDPEVMNPKFRSDGLIGEPTCPIPAVS